MAAFTQAPVMLSTSTTLPNPDYFIVITAGFMANLLMRVPISCYGSPGYSEFLPTLHTVASDGNLTRSLATFLEREIFLDFVFSTVELLVVSIQTALGQEPHGCLAYKRLAQWSEQRLSPLKSEEGHRMNGVLHQFALYLWVPVSVVFEKMATCLNKWLGLSSSNTPFA